MTREQSTEKNTPSAIGVDEPTKPGPLRRAALILGFVALTALTLHAFLPSSQPVVTRSAEGPILSYVGRLASDAGYLTLLDQMPALLAAARQAASDQLGLPDHREILVRFVDRNGGLARRSFMARTVHTPRGGPAIIEVDTATALSGRVEVEQLLVHEIVHVLLSRAVGEQYRRLPAWLREGLAVRIAGQDTGKLDRSISSSPRRPPADLVVRLAVHRHEPHDYALDGLALEKLEEMVGDRARQRLCECLVREEKWSRCRRELTGLDASEFEEIVFEYARRRISARTGDRAGRFILGLELLDEGQPAAGLGVFDELIAMGEGPFDREALLQSARCLVALERPSAAGDRLALLWELGSMGPVLAREAAELQVEILRDTGETAASARACEKVWWYHDGRVPPEQCAAAHGV